MEGRVGGVRVDVKGELKFLGWGGGGWWGVGLGGQSGCERRIEVFVKIPKKKKNLGGGGGRGGGSEWM